MVKIIKNFYTGKESLMDEAYEYVDGDFPLFQEEKAKEKEIQGEKKRKREVDDIELQSKKLANISEFVRLMNSLNPAWKENDRLNMQTQDLLKQAMGIDEDA